MQPLKMSRKLLRVALCALTAPVALFAQGWQHIASVQKVERLPDGVELTAGKAKVRVTIFRDGIFRVRAAQTGTFPRDFSWAVIETSQPPAVKIDDGKDEVRLSSGSIVARIHKSPLLIDFQRDTGDVIVADASNLPMAWENGRVHVWKKCPRTRVTTDWATKPDR